MRVPLLSKREIDSAKQKDRQQAVAEGLKLTKRIDGLRELEAETDQHYQKYRSETLAQIQSEIDAKFHEKQQLEDDIAKLIPKRKKLLIPLDAQWAELHNAEALLEDRQANVGQSEFRITLLDGELKQRESIVSRREGNIENTNKIASARFHESEQTLEHAREESAQIRTLAQELFDSSELREKVITAREAAFKTTLEQVEKDKKEIEIARKELSKGQATLRAGWVNLQKTANKLKL